MDGPLVVAELGFPGIVLGGADASVVEVAVLESEALPAHWGRLDAFEGPGHRRTVASVQTAIGELDAAICVLADA